MRLGKIGLPDFFDAFYPCFSLIEKPPLPRNNDDFPKGRERTTTERCTMTDSKNREHFLLKLRPGKKCRRLKLKFQSSPLKHNISDEFPQGRERTTTERCTMTDSKNLEHLLSMVAPRENIPPSESKISKLPAKTQRPLSPETRMNAAQSQLSLGRCGSNHPCSGGEGCFYLAKKRG